MNKKSSKGKKLLYTSAGLTAIIVFSVFTVGIGIADEKLAKVTRELPDYVEPNETFVVTLTQSGFMMNTGRVWEVLPEGFEYVDGSYTGGAPERVTYNPLNRTLDMPFAAETTITYEVNASSYDQTAVFSGTYKALVQGCIYEEEGPITGDTAVVVDGTPPWTDEHNPAKGAMGVPVDTNIIVHVKDDTEVDPYTIEMTVNGNPVSPSIIPAVPEKLDDWLVRYDPSVDFGSSEVVTVTIDASDMAGNAMATDVYNFTTVILEKPDLNVTRIEVNADIPYLCGLPFGPVSPGTRTQCNNISGEIEEDNGVATGAFHVCFYVNDDLKCKVPVAGMAGGDKKTVWCNCSWYPLAGPHTINVTVDCENEIGESDETNNTRLKDVTAVPHGLKGSAWQDGRNITTLQCHELDTINITYSVGDSERLSGYNNLWTQYTVNWTASDLPIPDVASIKKARVYVYYDWDRRPFSDPVYNYFNLTFNGVLMPPDAIYNDTKNPLGLCDGCTIGMCSYNYPYGMLAYNVTSVFNTGGNNATLDNSEPTTPHHVSMKGMLLMVVYSHPDEPERIIWINEGFDRLYAGNSYGVSSEEATTYAPFENCAPIPMDEIEKATLVTITNDAKDIPGSDKNRLYFNDQLLGDGAWTTPCPGSPGQNEIGCNVSDVTALLDPTDNTAAFQSHIPAAGTSGDWMEASNAVLVVKYPVLTGSIGGRITYTCNETGIADVIVNLTQGSVVDSTTTDSNGNYTFAEVVPGDYYVNASKPRVENVTGFWDNSTNVTVIAGVTSEVNMMLWLKGDLNNNGLSADAVDVLMMMDASAGIITPDWRYDLNHNGILADAVDVLMMMDASAGIIVLEDC